MVSAHKAWLQVQKLSGLKEAQWLTPKEFNRRLKLKLKFKIK